MEVFLNFKLQPALTVRSFREIVLRWAEGALSSWTSLGKKGSDAIRDRGKYKDSLILHVLPMALTTPWCVIAGFTSGQVCATIAITSHTNSSRETELVAVSPSYD